MFFGYDSRIENWSDFIEYIEEFWVQFSDFDSLHMQSYTCWKLGFVTNLGTSPKQVFEIK
jgi:hypothetical protein